MGCKVQCWGWYCYAPQNIGRWRGSKKKVGSPGNEWEKPYQMWYNARYPWVLYLNLVKFWDALLNSIKVPGFIWRFLCVFDFTFLFVSRTFFDRVARPMHDSTSSAKGTKELNDVLRQRSQGNWYYKRRRLIYRTTQLWSKFTAEIMYELDCDVVTDCLILPYPAFFRQYSEHHFGKAKKK